MLYSQKITLFNFIDSSQQYHSEVLNNVSGFRYPANYYTKEQMAEIVNYAKLHHIDVVLTKG